VPTHIDHLTIVASDFPRSLGIYDAALGAIGWARTVDLGDEEEDDAAVEAVGWGPTGLDAVLWLVVGEQATRGAHVALRVDSAASVVAFHASALEAGAQSHDPPRRWTIYRQGDFNAIVIDPDGNLIEAIASEA
jgi:catechol 2,3-dioxygenase-like lactoylglutathione lyase family enzyme